jgi:hypothetical protein
MKRRIIYLICVLLPSISFAQSDFEKVLKGGEILVNGLSFFKGNKSSSNSKTIESLCVKNKLADKITFKIVGQDEDGTDVKKELVIQKDGKECFLELPKGIYTYEILLSSKEVFKKGEYKIDDETIVTVKQE